jgi:hypothetical protein
VAIVNGSTATERMACAGGRIANHPATTSSSTAAAPTIHAAGLRYHTTDFCTATDATDPDDVSRLNRFRSARNSAAL